MKIEEQKKVQPIEIDLTLTPDLELKQPIPSIDLTKPETEQDPLWRDLSSNGQILVELINTTAAWKHRACANSGFILESFRDQFRIILQ